MAKQLSEVELNQISSIAYLDVIGDADSKIAEVYKELKEEITLGEVIDYYTAKGKYEGTTEGPTKMAERFTQENWGNKSELEHWQVFLDKLDNPKQREWIISDIKTFNKPNEDGFVACTVTTEPGVTVAVFRGSEPLTEPNFWNDWANNIRSIYMPANEQQKQAEVYIQNLAKNKDIQELYLTGHSLGGNLALFATMNMPKELMEKLIYCATYGAPGFNKTTLSEHEEAIAKLLKENKIFEYQNKYDFTGSILHNVSKAIIVDSADLEVGPAINHSSYYFALKTDDKGNLTFKLTEDQTKSFLCDVVHLLTTEFETLPIEQKKIVVEALMPFIKEGIHNGESYKKVMITGLGNPATRPVTTVVLAGATLTTLQAIRGVVILILANKVSKVVLDTYREILDKAFETMDDVTEIYEKFKEETIKAVHGVMDTVEAIKLEMEMKKFFMHMEYKKIVPARLKPKVKENGWISTPQVFNGAALGISELGVSLVVLNQLYREMNTVGGMISKDHVRKLNKCKDANENIRRRYSSCAAYSGWPEIIAQCNAIDRKIDEIKATFESLGKEMGKDAISIKKAIDIYSQTEKEAKTLIKAR